MNCSVWVALGFSPLGVGLLCLVLTKSATGLVWPWNSGCRLSAVQESFCDGGTPDEMHTLGMI